MFLHRGHLVNIKEEGYDCVDIFFPFEVSIMLPFCTIGHKLGCYLVYFVLGKILFSSSSFTNLCAKLLISLSISSHFWSGNTLRWLREDAYFFPFIFSWGSFLPIDFLAKVKFSSPSRESSWSWSKVWNLLSLRVKLKSDSRALTNTTQEVAWGGFFSIGRLLYYLLDLFMNSDISSSSFFLIALNSVKT